MNNEQLDQIVSDLTEQGHHVTVIEEYCLQYPSGKQRAVHRNWFKTYAQQLAEKPGISKLVTRKVIRIEGEWQ